MRVHRNVVTNTFSFL